MREAVLNLGLAYLRLGEMEESAAQLARAGEWALMAGDRRTSVLVKVFQSEWHRRSGDLAQAKRLAWAAVDEAQEGPSGQLPAEADLALGEVSLEERQGSDAQHYLERCRGLARKLGLRRLELAADIALAEVALAGNEPGVAERLAELAAQAAQAGFEDLRERLLALQARVEPGAEGNGYKE